jgi:glucose-6-phosphate isomerase
MNLVLQDRDAVKISPDALEESFQYLLTEVHTIEKELKNRYETRYASLFLPFDTQQVALVMQLVEEKKRLQPTLLLIIGIGGSNLGTMVLVQALFGTLYNETLAIKCYCADTIDTDYIAALYRLIEIHLQSKQAMLINVITKSGTTTETIANFEIFLDLLKRYYPDTFWRYVVVTTDHDSPLYQISRTYNFSVLSPARYVGGRFSVFSYVGLFPLALLGVDITALLAGARDAVIAGMSEQITTNHAAFSAVVKYIHYQQHIRIHDLFIFSAQLSWVGAWYRQLLAESIGKQYNTAGQEVFVGITPLVSIGSTDLHSMGQLYLGGPYDKLTTFVSIEANQYTMLVGHNNEFEHSVANIQGKSLSCIMKAIMTGVTRAYRNSNRPFFCISIPHISPYYLGQLLQMYMLEVLYVGYLLQVNPFDQPQVELYKRETRKLLADE